MTKRPIDNPRFVYQLESIRPNLDLRSTDYVTLGMFASPDLLRYRVSVLTKSKEVHKNKAWTPGRNDNEYVLRFGNMYYRMTRHVLQTRYR